MTAAKRERKLGRPTKLTPALARAICKDVKSGKPLHIAAGLNGVHYDTLREWQRQGEKPNCEDAALIAFSVDLARARASAENDLINSIKRKSRASPRRMNAPDWKADLSILKVMNPKVYSEKQAVEVTGKDGGPVAANVTVATVVELPPLDGDES